MCVYRHEDGTVRFWDASGVALTPLYKLGTANVFHTDCDPSDDPQDPSNDPDMQQEEEWPPFRKVRTEEMSARGEMKRSKNKSPPSGDQPQDLILPAVGIKTICFTHTVSPVTLHLWPNFPHLIVFMCLVFRQTHPIVPVIKTRL